MHFEKGFQGGESGGVDKMLERLQTQQYGRAVTFLVAPGSFAEDIFVPVSTSELKAWVDELPGHDAHAKLSAS